MTNGQIPLVSIILVNYNGVDVLPNCLSSLNKFIPKSECEIILVDNNSQDQSLDIITQFPDIKVIELSENRGFGAGNNFGAKFAQGEFLFLLNTDTIVNDNIIPHFIELMRSDAKIGVIGPKLLNPDYSFQISFAAEIGIQGEAVTRKMHQNPQRIEQEYKNTLAVDIVVGAAFFIRASLFHTLGGFDENFFMYFEEADLCKRVQNHGYKIIYTPNVSLIHLRGHTVKKAANAMAVEYRRSQIYYYQKHRPQWEQVVLKFYLFSKFLFNFITTTNPYYLKIMMLVVRRK